MKDVFERLDLRTREISGHPFFSFLRDPAAPVERRFAFVRAVAPWILGFADLCAFVLEDERATDPFQQLVNVHVREDEGHWQWFLDDIAVLGQDTELRFTETLRFLWGPATAQTRRLTYRMIALGAKTTSIERVMLVEAMEAVNKVAFGAALHAADEFERASNRKLVFFGKAHNEVEAQHALEGDDARRALLEAQPSEEQRDAMLILIDDVFAAFSASMDELFRFSRQ